MSHASFRQADLQRIMRAAKKTGATVQVDLRSLVVTIFPGSNAPVAPSPTHGFAPDGVEDWSENDDYPRLHKGPMPPPPIQPALDHREDRIMSQLENLGVGVRLPSGGIRSFGPHTQKKLQDRGYIEVFHQPGRKFVDDEICLTKKGMADLRARDQHRKRYPRL
jgi:hypothetical protein